jgi:carbonic anhydrase/acetyltransferase-like protein (isoleucine patch superfamily)
MSHRRSPIAVHRGASGANTLSGVVIEHEGRRPRIAPSAYVAPNAVVAGDVTVGDDCRILFGAVLTAEHDGSIVLGERCIVMENALVRGRPGHRTSLGDHVIVGPHAHLNGVEVGDDAFVATGASLFPGARVGARAEVRIGGVVHVNSALPDDGLVPIGWVAVGDPATVLPPDRHDEIWAIQEQLDFPGTVFGIDRPPPGGTIQPEVSRRYADLFGRHRGDRIL